MLECPYIYTYTCRMRYTSDPKKKAANLKKHGYDFDEAPLVIESASAVTFEDRRFQYDGSDLSRWACCAGLRTDRVVIATAETDQEIRVISMRKAQRNEKEIYARNL